MSNAAPEEDFTIFDQVHPGHEWRSRNDLFGLEGFIVAQSIDEIDYYLFPEPGRPAVRRVYYENGVPVSYSAAAFETADQEDPTDFIEMQ